MNYTITPEEVVKIARLSHIELLADQINPLLKQLSSVLGYAALVTTYISPAYAVSTATKQQNRTHPDSVVHTEREISLSQVPQREQGYIVVPMILEIAS